MKIGQTVFEVFSHFAPPPSPNRVNKLKSGDNGLSTVNNFLCSSMYVRNFRDWRNPCLKSSPIMAPGKSRCGGGRRAVLAARSLECNSI